MSKSSLFGLPVIDRKKPKPRGRFSMIASLSGLLEQIELKAALRKWISNKRPDLRGIASGEEFKTLEREFFDSKGVQTFDVLIDFLKKSKLAYAKQHRPPAKTRIRPIGGQTAPEILKASQKAQEYRASGERVNWRRVAKKVLPHPGKPSTKRKRDGEVIEVTWVERVHDLEDSVNSYMRRQRERKKVVAGK